MIVRDGRERPVQEISHGDHWCLAFADENEQRQAVAAYLRQGLERGERVLYFADRPPQQVLGWLTAAGVDPAGALASGQLRVSTVENGYLKAGAFDADAVCATLRREVAEALSSGYPGCRVSGEMSWALRQEPGTDQLPLYENKVSELLAGQRASAVCQYDIRRFASVHLDALDACHRGTVAIEALHADGRLRLLPSLRAGRRTLRVVGTVDHKTGEALAAALETALSWPGDVWVDMSGLEFIDLAGVRTLARTAARLPQGRHMYVVDLAPLLNRVISLVGWEDLALTVRSREVTR